MMLICVLERVLFGPPSFFFLFSLPIPGDVNEIDILCVLTPKIPLFATEKYQYTSALGRENLNMSRAKKEAASEGKILAQEEQAAMNPPPFSIEQLQELLTESMKELKEGQKKLSDRIQALELKQQQTSSAGNAGTREEKSGERDKCATEAGVQEIAPPEQQSRQAASSSYGPSRFFQMEQLRQQPPPPPSS